MFYQQIYNNSNFEQFKHENGLAGTGNSILLLVFLLKKQHNNKTSVKM